MVILHENFSKFLMDKGFNGKKYGTQHCFTKSMWDGEWAFTHENNQVQVYDFYVGKNGEYYGIGNYNNKERKICALPAFDLWEDFILFPLFVEHKYQLEIIEKFEKHSIEGNEVEFFKFLYNIMDKKFFIIGEYKNGNGFTK